ncbi:MAG: methyltransferase [Tetrasphaera sp.]
MSEETWVTLARATTPRGDLALRERRRSGHVVHELIIAGVFAMDSVDVSSEVALAESALAGAHNPARVLVGGLGLGYTAAALLEDARVEQVVIAELEGPLIAWARAGLTPQLGALAASPRVELREQDIAHSLAAAESFDAILLDVDNGPSFLVHQENGSLYADSALAQAISLLTSGGVLSIWAAQPEPALLERLTRLSAGRNGWTVEERLIPISRDGRSFDYAIYQVR